MSIGKFERRYQLCVEAEGYVDLLENNEFMFGMEQEEALALSSLLRDMVDAMLLRDVVDATLLSEEE